MTQPQETNQFILTQVFKNHSELLFDDWNQTQVLKWSKQRQPVFTSVIAERAIAELYPELHKHEAVAETPRLSVYEQQQNAKFNAELFQRLEKDPRLARLTREEAQKVQDWLTKVAGDPSQVRYDEELVFAAAYNCGVKLWTPPPPAPPLPPKERLESWQLPIPSTKHTLRNASHKQVKDYLDRLRKAQQN